MRGGIDQAGHRVSSGSWRCFALRIRAAGIFPSPGYGRAQRTRVTRHCATGSVVVAALIRHMPLTGAVVR
jgi:hypothetical protein